MLSLLQCCFAIYRGGFNCAMKQGHLAICRGFVGDTTANCSDIGIIMNHYMALLKNQYTEWKVSEWLNYGLKDRVLFLLGDKLMNSIPSRGFILTHYFRIPSR